MTHNGKPQAATWGGRKADAGATSFHSHYSTGGGARQRSGPAHGRIVGDTWEKTARQSLHGLRSPRGWAADVADLTAAESSGAALLHVRDLENMRHFWAALALFRRRGFPLDRGFGPQVGLDLDWWRPSRDAALELDAQDSAPVEPEPGEPVQLDLFGMGARR